MSYDIPNIDEVRATTDSVNAPDVQALCASIADWIRKSALNGHTAVEYTCVRDSGTMFNRATAEAVAKAYQEKGYSAIASRDPRGITLVIDWSQQ